MQDDGRTPLYFASQQGHTTIVELLVKNGAQVDVRRIEVRTNLPYSQCHTLSFQ